MTNPDSASPEASHKFLGIEDVTSMTSLSRASVYRLTKEGDFPKAIALTQRRVAWRQQDIAAWIDARITEARIKSIAREAAE